MIGSSFGIEAKQKLPLIRYGWLIPSYACNKRCDFCYNGEDLLSDKSKASDEDASRLARVFTALTLRHCTIIGGEPLIYSGLTELVRVVRSTGTPVSIVTNGIALVQAPARYSWLSTDVVDSLLVSLEAPRFEVVEQSDVLLHQDSSPSKGRPLPIISDSKAAVSMPAEEIVCRLSQQSSLPIRYVIKLFRESVRSVPALLEQIAESGAHRNVLFSFGTGVIPEQSASARLLLNPREIAAWYVRLDEIVERLGLIATFYMNLPLCLFPSQFLARVIPESRGSFGCSLIRGDSIVLDHHGNFGQCTHFMPNATENIFRSKGHSAEQVIARAWRYGEPAKVRDALAVARSSKCLKCVSFEKNCCGGCPILWAHHDPEDFIGCGPENLPAMS